MLCSNSAVPGFGQEAGSTRLLVRSLGLPSILSSDVFGYGCKSAEIQWGNLMRHAVYNLLKIHRIEPLPENV